MKQNNTAADFLSKRVLTFPSDENMSDKDIKRNVQAIMIEFAKHHVELALLTASEQVAVDYTFDADDEFTQIYYADKDSILNSYSLDLIK